MNVKRILKRYWLIGLIAVLIVLFLIPRFPAQADNTTAPTAKVVSVKVAETAETSGTLQAQPFASLTWKTSGMVEEVYVKAGDQVQAGDVLMKLKTSTLDTSILSAQADLIHAQKEMDDLLVSSTTDFAQAVIDLRDAKQAYDRAANYLEFLERSKTTRQTQSKLFIDSLNRGSKRYVFKTKEFKGAPEDWFIAAENDLVLKKAQLEDAQRAYDRLKDGANARDVTIAQARIDAAQATVDSMNIIAPFDGQVLYVASRPEDMVTADAVALNMADMEHLYIETQVSESEIASFHAGNPASATLQVMPGLELTGHVAAVNPLGEVEASSVQYTLLIDIDQVPEDVFLPLGSTANVTIQVKEAAQSLAVPITVIQNDAKGEYVLVVQADGSTKRVDVVTGTIVGDLVTVTGDLQEDESLTASQNNRMSGPAGMFGGRK